MNNGRHLQIINRDNEKRRKRNIKQTQNVNAVNIITYTAHNEAQRWAYFREEAQGNISGKKILTGFWVDLGRKTKKESKIIYKASAILCLQNKFKTSKSQEY